MILPIVKFGPRHFLKKYAQLLSTRRYGNQVFKQWVKHWKDFCLEINMPKENY